MERSPNYEIYFCETAINPGCEEGRNLGLAYYLNFLIACVEIPVVLIYFILVKGERKREILGLA